MASIARICPQRALTSYIKPPQSLRPLTTASIRTTRPTTTPPSHHSQPPKYQSSQPRRPYHSTLHPALPVHEYTNSQIAILEASLAHTPVHGFTHTSILLGARDAGFLDVSIQLLPNGEYDLILFWLASRRGLLRAAVESGEIQFPAGQDVQSKIKTLIMKRMKMNEVVRGQWQEVGYTPIFNLSFARSIAIAILTKIRPSPKCLF
jgi:ubiquinone biosynthesis protein COQ9